MNVAWHPAELNPDYPLGVYFEMERKTVTVEEPVVVGWDEGEGEAIMGTVAHEREVDVPVRLAVWVNASPEHKQHAGGWFEPYKGKPGSYRPQRDAEPGEDGYCVNPDADYVEQARVNREDRKRVERELDALEAAARKSLDGEALATRLAEIERARP